MIPEYCVTEWRQQVPWAQDHQVEQDLIISRALVCLYTNEKIKESLVFRGGTLFWGIILVKVFTSFMNVPVV